MSWPDSGTLRAILDLPGVPGSTRDDIEKYLDDPAGWAEALENFTYCGGIANMECQTDDQEEAYRLWLELPAAVQRHWAQLLDKGAV